MSTRSIAERNRDPADAKATSQQRRQKLARLVPLPHRRKSVRKNRIDVVRRRTLVPTAGLIFLTTCATTDPIERDVDYRGEMRRLVMEVSAAAKVARPDFLVFVNNGEELVTVSGAPDSEIDHEYVEAIDGFLIESLFYGAGGVDETTGEGQRNFSLPYLHGVRDAGVDVLVIDYCADPEKQSDSFRRNRELGFLAYPSPTIALDRARRFEEPADFLYLVNPWRYDRTEFVELVASYPVDLVFIDLSYEGSRLVAAEIEAMRGASNRKIIAYMSIGEASTFRFYWRPGWDLRRPDWMEAENPAWPGSFRVAYWRDEWKQIILRAQHSYLNSIVRAGFDGVILDPVDTFG